MAYSLKDTFKALGSRKMAYLFMMGISSGLPFALTLGTLQAWMKDVNIDLKTIGLFAFLRLPFSLKFLWSPLIDRYQIPFLDKRRGWAFITQGLMAACLFGMAATDPATQIQQLVIFTLLLNFFAASQDIVLDAYRREVLRDEELGLGVSVFVNGYIIAFRYISGALALFLAGSPFFIPYPQIYLGMGVFMGLLMLMTVKAPRIEKELDPPKTLQEAFIGPLKEYFSRPESLTILAFIVLYKVGDAMAGTMTLPFIKEVGFSNAEYVAIVKLWGPIATVIGGIIGGHFVLKLGIMRSLFFMGIFQALSTATFALLQYSGKSNWVLAGIVAFENLTAQMGTAAYAAYMASVTNVRFTATQYALLSSLMAVPGVVFASRTGAMAESMGWSSFFVFCALIAIPGMLLIPVLQQSERKGAVNVFRVAVISFTILAITYALSTSTWDLFQLMISKINI